MKIIIDGQRVIVREPDMLVAGSVHQYVMDVEWTEEWGSYDRILVFKRVDPHLIVEKAVEAGTRTVDIPFEVLGEDSVIQIGAYGMRGEAVRPTVWSNKLAVFVGVTPGEAAKTPTILPWEDIVRRIGDLSMLETEDRSSLVSAVNWLKNNSESPKDAVKAYSKPEKIKPYLYMTDYITTDYDYAREYFESHNEGVSGSCCAIRNGDLYGRNFDWTYDDGVEFVVHTNAYTGKFASIGVAGGASLKESDMDGEDINEAMRIVPFFTRDGINEHGVTVSTLVVPNEGHRTVSIPDLEKRDSINGIMLTRYVLDNFRSAYEACEYIQNYVSVWFSDAVYDMGYEQHYMVADENSTYILEFVDDRAVITDIHEAPYVTNFFIDGVRFNADGSVYTPNTLSDGSPVEDNLITPHGSGLERYNILAEGYSNADTFLNMRKLLDRLKYTNAYPTSETAADPAWYTEFVHGDLRCDSPVSDFSEALAQAGEAYISRARNGVTWQTTHSVIYNIRERSMALRVQENSEEFYFRLNELFFNHVANTDIHVTAEEKAEWNSAGEAVSDKLTEPSSGMAVGKYFRIASIDDSGHAVLEAVDAPDSAMKVKLAGTEQTPDTDGYVDIPIATNLTVGLVKIRYQGNFKADGQGYVYFSKISDADIFNRATTTFSSSNVVSLSQVDKIVKCVLSDGAGADWTDAEKSGAWQRLTSIKTTMDAVAVAGAAYYLGELSTLTISMPTDAMLGQSITVVFSSGATACTLTCDLTGFDFVPKANKTNKLVFTLIHKADASVIGDIDKWTVETEES